MRRPGVRGAILLTVAMWALLGAGYLAGLRFHPALIVAVPVCVAAYALIRGQHLARPAFLPAAPAPDPAPPRDRRLSQLAWMLRAGTQEETWRRGVRPHLATLAGEALRERRGIDLEDSPRAAREALGEDLWRVTQGTAPAPTSTTALSALIERIHAL